LLISLVLLDLTLAPAQAQRRFYPGTGGGIAVGVGVGSYAPFGPFVGPGFGRYGFGPAYGLFPTYYDGFYGNGFSAYGPPVPTYGAIPGVFGGIDQKIYPPAPILFGPRFGYGLYRGGYRPPSASHVHPNFQTEALGIINDLPDLQPVPILRPLHIEVRCMDNAMVQINRQPTNQTGSFRVFQTPSISTTEEVTYEVRATWEQEGKTITKLKAATGKGGERVIVDFTTVK
jgi:uncharacterized protein (TIGR03000 family)